MQDQPIALSLTGTRRLHAVALLYATLIFPDPAELARRQSFFCAFYTELVVAHAEANPDWALSEQPLIPFALLHPPGDMKRAARTLQTQLRNRILAGRMAMPFLQAVETGAPPKGWESLTLNLALEWGLGQLASKNIDNLRKRVWAPSQPVLHLCAALARLDFAVTDGKTPLPLYEWFRDGTFIETWIMLAETMETSLAASRLGIDPATLHRFRLIDGPRTADA